MGISAEDLGFSVEDPEYSENLGHSEDMGNSVEDLEELVSRRKVPGTLSRRLWVLRLGKVGKNFWYAQ